MVLAVQLTCYLSVSVSMPQLRGAGAHDTKLKDFKYLQVFGVHHRGLP